MPARWITEEEYYALGNGMPTEAEISGGTNAAQSTSGQALESKAGPQTLEQKDFQGNAIVHDILTKGGLNESETSNKTTSYGAVNSTITEKAPSISKTFQQNKSYSESYQTKTENINTQTYTRDIQSPQYTKTQNNLNLSVPDNLNVNAAQSITRNINTRNATIGTHTMSGQNYNFTGNTIQRFGDMTIIKGDFVSFKANSFKLNAGPDAAPQPVKPRRAPPDMFAKVSGEFGSKTVSLPPAYNNSYIIHADFTVSGEYEMESLNSMNPTTITKDSIQTDMTKVIGDYFYGMEITSPTNTNNIEEGLSPTFTIGNKYGAYTLSGSGSINVYSQDQQIFVFNYAISISEDKKLVDEWLLTLSGTLKATVTVEKRTHLDKLEIEINDMIKNVNAELKAHANNPYYGPILRALNTYTRPTIQAMYQEAEFLEKAAVDDLAAIAS